ncbi:MAG: hypothetical protein WCJ42_09665 [Actinomycetes bacterium]
MTTLLDDLKPDSLTRVMRPTVFSAMALGLIGFGVSIWLSAPTAAVGIVIGIVAAIFNVRILGAGVLRVPADQAEETKSVRRLLGKNSAVRLTLITAVAIGLVLLNHPLGIGMVVGLVLFQIAFVVNAGRVIIATKAG